MLLDRQILSFLFNLSFPAALPPDFAVLHPYKSAEVRKVCERFYRKFYHDSSSRHFIVGINPGRFGAGVTGIPFTDPIRLQSACGIENDWPKKQELSSVFVYELIEAFGGAEKFYKTFYISAVSPLGFTKSGKNINYYDNKQLQESVMPFAVDCFNKQLSWGVNTKIAFCLGEGRNFKHLYDLNEQHNFFKEIIPLPHPRFVMQYKLRSKQDYIDKYLHAFSSCF